MREGRLVAERYRVREVLGTGGMGTVLRVRDEVLGRDAALKLLTAMTGDEALGRFRREGQILARLRHPGLVEVWDYGVEDGQAFIAQEVLDGEDLAARIGRGALLDGGALRRLATELADTLAYLHGEGVIHRDIKPANVFLRTDGSCVLLDFGVARDLERSAMTLENRLVGTLLYMAPEQLTGSPADSRSDVYGVGLVLYEAGTGQPLHGSPSNVGRFMDDMAAGRLPLPVSGEALEEDMLRVVRACCARDPADRPRDGAALARLVAGRGPRAARAAATTVVAAQSRAAFPVTSAAGTSSSPRGAAPRLSWAAGAAAAAVLVLGMLVWTGGHGEAPPEPGRSVEPLEWVQWTSGVELSLPYLEGGDLAWRLTGEGSEPRQGRVAGEKGAARLAVSGLPPGFRGVLTVEAGGRVLGQWEVALPGHDFREPVQARFGPSWVEVAYRLHGRAALTLEVEPVGGRVERQRVRGEAGRVAVSLLEGRSRETSWRLLRGTRLLASGQGRVGLGRRTSLAELSGLPELTRSLSYPPSCSEGEILMAVSPSFLASLRPLPSPSGTTLAVNWAVALSRRGIEPWALGEQPAEGMEHPLVLAQLLPGGDCLVVSRGDGGYVARLRGGLRRAAYAERRPPTWGRLVEGPSPEDVTGSGEPRVELGAEVVRVSAASLGRSEQVVAAQLRGPGGALVEPWFVSTEGEGLRVVRGEPLPGASGVLGVGAVGGRFAVVWTGEPEQPLVHLWTVDCRAPGGPRVVARREVASWRDLYSVEGEGGVVVASVGPRRIVAAAGRRLFVIDLDEGGTPAVGRVDVTLDESSRPQSVHVLDDGTVAVLVVRRVYRLANLPSRIDAVVLRPGGTGPGGYSVELRPTGLQVASAVHVTARTAWRPRGDRLWAMPGSTLLALGASAELPLRFRADLVGVDGYLPLAVTRSGVFAFTRTGDVVGCDLEPAEGAPHAGR